MGGLGLLLDLELVRLRAGSVGPRQGQALPIGCQGQLRQQRPDSNGRRPALPGLLRTARGGRRGRRVGHRHRRLPELGKAELFTLVFGDGKVPAIEDVVNISGWLMLYATRNVNAGRWRELIDSIGGVLHRKIWEPVQACLEKLGVRGPQSELVWFPQGASAVLPVHSAYRATATGRHFLIADYAVRYAPSAAILLDALPAQKGNGPAVLIANPSLDQPLPNTEIELLLVEQTLAGSTEVTALTRAAATPEAVLPHLANIGLFHFAGHATFNLEDPFRSQLLLSSAVTVDDLQPALEKTPPQVVVLSACQTGMAQVTAMADEALGFASLFLNLGTRTVLATLWPVDDLASALLVGAFYRAWKQEGQSPAQALRASQNWLRTASPEDLSARLGTLKDAAPSVRVLASRARRRFFAMEANSTPYASPEFWAGFTLVGQ